MVPQIKKILYATDLSENSKAALAWAMTLADRHEARVVLFHTVEEISSAGNVTIQSYFGETEWERHKKNIADQAVAMMRQRAEQFCEAVKADMAACPFVVDEIMVRRGHPVDQIIGIAVQQQCDLIVMGSRGAGSFAGTVMGSTARRVLRRSKVPVLVIPLPPGD